VLSRRNLDVLARNPLTLAILAGSPALVIAMFTVLFKPNSFDANGSATAYWMAFAAFFFGLTYGLLQIVTEMAIVRRERLVGLRVGPYLMAKARCYADPARSRPDDARDAGALIDSEPASTPRLTVSLMALQSRRSRSGCRLGRIRSAGHARTAAASQPSCSLERSCRSGHGRAGRDQRVRAGVGATRPARPRARRRSSVGILVVLSVFLAGRCPRSAGELTTLAVWRATTRFSSAATVHREVTEVSEARRSRRAVLASARRCRP
jgi:hypothetical protein